MYEDSILKEVRAAREAYARSHGYNPRSMVADLRARDERGDWPVVRLAPRRPTNPGITIPPTGKGPPCPEPGRPE